MDSDEWRQHFGKLRKLWGNPDPAEAFDWLRHVRVRTLDEESLRSFAEVRLEPLVEGDTSSVAAVLAQFALESVYQELRAYDIWARLTERGYGRRDWANDPRVLANVEAQNGRYLDGLREELVGGAVIPREEASQGLDLLVGEATDGMRSPVRPAWAKAAPSCRSWRV